VCSDGKTIISEDKIKCNILKAPPVVLVYEEHCQLEALSEKWFLPTEHNSMNTATM
jgi:hypothetical protein